MDVYLRTSTGKVVRLTRSKGPDQYPSFSVDGKRIAFGRVHAGNEDVYVIHPSSVPLPPPAVPSQPSW